jgi:uncharacterized protein YdeI (YjbR/CyaY-like superfamily)
MSPGSASKRYPKELNKVSDAAAAAETSVNLSDSLERFSMLSRIETSAKEQNTRTTKI